MTSRERLLTAFHGGTPDKVPVAPRLDLVWMRNAGPETADAMIRKTDVVVHVDLLPDYVHFFGAEAGRRASVRTEGDRRFEEIDTPKGRIAREIVIEPNMMDWADRHFFDRPEDMEKALSLPYRPAEADLSGYNAWRDRIGDQGLVLAHLPNALCCPGLWTDPEEYLVRACATHTDLVLELLRKVSANILDRAERLLAAGLRHFMISGGELASQTLMGPQWFSRFVAPFDGPLVETIRGRGGVVWYHCHGKIRSIHEEIADLGVHVLTPCEKPPQGDIELAELKQSIGDRVCLAGNLDDEQLLATGDRQAIRARVEECLAAAMQGGAYCLGGTEGCVYSPANAEAYLYLCELRDEMGGY